MENSTDSIEDVINRLGNKFASLKLINSKPIQYQAQGRLRLDGKVIGKDIKITDVDPTCALTQLESKLKEKLSNFNNNNSN